MSSSLFVTSLIITLLRSALAPVSFGEEAVTAEPPLRRSNRRPRPAARPPTPPPRRARRVRTEAEWEEWEETELLEETEIIVENEVEVSFKEGSYSKES